MKLMAMWDQGLESGFNLSAGRERGTLDIAEVVHDYSKFFIL